jgi:hypothetical protein
MLLMVGGVGLAATVVNMINPPQKCALTTEIIRTLPVPEVKPPTPAIHWSWPILDRLDRPLPLPARDPDMEEDNAEASRVDKPEKHRHSYRHHRRHWR